MVVQEAEMMNNSAELGEVESQLQTDEQLLQEAANKDSHNHALSSLGRQSSIYSLTLDEFQHTLCDTGKNFGSMNMDEFLSSIWNAEENQQASNAIISLNHQQLPSSADNNNNNHNKGMATIRKQPSLPRQGSLSLPAPLCRKTVEEVWSEIHKGQQNQQQNDHIQSNNNSINGNGNGNGSGSSVLNNNNNNNGNTEAAPRQPTFGEMTLEDFLVKAGVVREPCAMPAAAVPAASSASSQQHHHQQQQQYGLYTATNATMAPSSFVARPVIGSGGVAGNVVAPPYPPVAQGSAGERDGSGGGYGVGLCYGGRVVNNGAGGGYGPPPTIAGMGGPLSPASSDGVGPGEAQFGVEMGVLRGRKRMVDGPVEKVVERRQRRMIKNRESAARSRARKQAYTVELEAELNQLREENTQLKQALAELERRRRQQCFEEMNARVQTKTQKAIEKLRALRRNLSCPL